MWSSIGFCATTVNKNPNKQLGGVHMATSSIFTHIKITDPKKAEAFVDAMEASANDPKVKPSAPIIPTITDLDAIRKLVAKRNASK